ncbi:hypothetical protein GPA27_19725 [Aromatoleum toluolicum]|uniref:Uncharacterized protein n=1 Tax=Aromatoleum toluolicum TaxID=90060 RepID=A0ABX1NJV9_9RHOO|nr:hypothetical protein [Aromatoleum toluolicum]NMF99611.1 hypothetical protein [Aromatoleum toluolicum]
MPEYLWTDRHFDEMSWHDCNVHGLRVVEGEYGAGELILDLDYIVEWLCEAQGCSFRIVPATLRFLEVTNLRLALDYASPGAAMGPFSIHAIERRDEPRERYVAQVWNIAINWPKGEIAFEAKGFEQRATGAPVVSAAQCLRPDERGNHGQAG